MIMSFLTFCLSCSQLFTEGKFTGLSSMWRLLTCHSYGVGALQDCCLVLYLYLCFWDSQEEIHVVLKLFEIKLRNMKKLSYLLNVHLINCPVIFNYCISIIIKLQDVIGYCGWKKEKHLPIKTRRTRKKSN